jgi:NADPH2:quinone reductase
MRPASSTMRAAQVVRLDGPTGVEVRERPVPVRPDGEYLVDVHAVGVAFPDLLFSQGRYQLRPEPPFTIGIDFAGVVRERPDGGAYPIGARVAGWVPAGAAADVVAVSPTHVFSLPDTVSFVVGSALPMNYLTAHYALTRRGDLRPGERVLIHGAAGGVGVATVQVARWLGAEVVAVVSTDARAEVAAAAGAHHVVPAADFAARTREVTGGAGVDVVVDVVGGDDLAVDSVRCLAPLGRLLVLGFASGSIGSLRLNRLLLGNVDVRGVSWGPYTRLHPDYPAQQWIEMGPGFADGSLAPVIHATYPLERTAAALADLERREVVGKAVLVLR